MSKENKNKTIADILYTGTAIAIALAGWAIGASIAQSEFVLPNIADTLTALPRVFASAEFWSGLCGTLLRSCVGYSIAVALFFATFYLSMSFRVFMRIVEPVISMLRSLPAVAITLVLILALGGNGAPVLLGILVIFPIMYSSARSRTATVPSELLEICRICGANRWQTFRAVHLPTLAGGLPDSLSSAFSYNIKAVIGAEILAQTARSLGMLMKLAQTLLQPALLIALVLVAIIVAVVAEAIIRALLSAVLERYRE